MKRVILIAAVLSVCTSLAGWRGRFDEQFAAALNAGTPIPAVAWYKLDGNALDSSGNGYHGTWAGTEDYAAGKFAGQAGAFVADAIVAGANTVSAPPVTVTAWVKYDKNMTFMEFFQLSYITTPMRFSVGPGNTANSVCSRMSIGGTLYTTSGGGIISTGAWHHVAAIYGESEAVATIYIDGVVASANVGELPLSGRNDSKVRLGAVRGFDGGKLDDVRIYNRALSAANIARIMESQDNEPLEELQ